MEDEYADFAEVYDLFYGDYEEDVEFYTKLAETYGEPILELGCGTGRILLKIAEKGYRIEGLDASESMLEKLFEKAKQKGLSDKIKVYKGDMRELDLGKKYKLIIIPFSAIIHILTIEDMLKTFKNIYRHLDNGGAFAFDVFTPNFKLIAEKKRQVFDIRDVSGGKLLLWETTKYDLTHHTLEAKRYVKLISNSQTKDYLWEFKGRFWFKSELELMLKIAGFEKINTYGGFNYEPYEYEKGRIIIVAEKVKYDLN